MRAIKTLLFICLNLTVVSAMAHNAWKLETENSTFNFISVKKGSVVEVHKFTKLTGDISELGAVSLSIDLSSVDTNIEIRDERIKSMLFEIGIFIPRATFSATISEELLTSLKVGESMPYVLEGFIDLHGVNSEISVETVIVRQAERKIMVMTAKPFVIKASEFRLSEGIEKLMKIANLPSITQQVPVSFVLSFKRY